MAQFVLKFYQDDQRKNYRIIDNNGETWFSLEDVCNKLSVNISDAHKWLKSDEIANVPLTPPSGIIIAVSEAGLYRLAFKSDSKEAEDFVTWVTKEVLPSIRKTGGYQSKTPAFIARANKNWDKVDSGYFSVINELSVIVWGRLEREGHILADRSPDGTEIRPDVSVGRFFSMWLEEHHQAHAPNHKTYFHDTGEKVIEARQYPNEMLGLFRAYVDNVWWPEKFENYIKKRDPAALQHLPALLPPKSAQPRRL